MAHSSFVYAAIIIMMTIFIIRVWWQISCYCYTSVLHNICLSSNTEGMLISHTWHAWRAICKSHALGGTIFLLVFLQTPLLQICKIWKFVKEYIILSCSVFNNCSHLSNFDQTFQIQNIKLLSVLKCSSTFNTHAYICPVHKIQMLKLLETSWNFKNQMCDSERQAFYIWLVLN